MEVEPSRTAQDCNLKYENNEINEELCAIYGTEMLVFDILLEAGNQPMLLMSTEALVFRVLVRRRLTA